MVSKEVGIKFGLPLDEEVGGDGGKLLKHGGLGQVFPKNEKHINSTFTYNCLIFTYCS